MRGKGKERQYCVNKTPQEPHIMPENLREGCVCGPRLYSQDYYTLAKIYMAHRGPTAA